jgi:hypothetical protein
MRLLVIESDPHAADTTAATLQAAGHEVVRCFAPGVGSFPCQALTEGCPIDEGIDVALVLRARPWPKPTPCERGAVCAIRAGVPLVVAGNRALDPWASWASAGLDGTEGLVAACEEAAAASRGAAGHGLPGP